MAITIAKMLMLIFISAILIILAAYSTTFKARAKRTAFVYELVAATLIISDSNLVLGIAEFIIFQVIMIFSIIASLYAYAEIEISAKNKINKDMNSFEKSAALVVIPFRRDEVEVTHQTTSAMQDLTFCVFVVCTTILTSIRPVLLFPFYGRNWALFIVSLIIVIINFWVAATDSSLRAIDSMNLNSESTLSHCGVFISGAFIFYCVVQTIAGMIYLGADEDAIEKTSTMGEPKIYSEIPPISEQYNYEDKLPYPAKKLDVNENIYLIEHRSEEEYFFYLNDFEFVDIWDKHNQKGVIVHLSNEDIKPYVTVTDKYYINPKGEEEVLETIYEFYIQKEQILTY